MGLFEKPPLIFRSYSRPGILVAWNLIGLRTLLYPVKMLVIAYHEVCIVFPSTSVPYPVIFPDNSLPTQFWHILVGVCLGQRLHSISIDPTDGGRVAFSDADVVLLPLQPVACYFVS